MSDGNERRAHEQMQKEIAEAERNRYQKQLDDWWRSQRALEEELSDQYFVGGFQEFHSRTLSFTKGRRDPDWGVR